MVYIEGEQDFNPDLAKNENLEEILEEIMVTYGTELATLAFSYVKDAGLAKDIVQNVFISCSSSLQKFKGESSLKTWLYRITINQCKDHLKSAYFKRILLPGKQEDNSTPHADSPEAELLEKDHKRQIRDCIMSLSPKYKEVIFLYYYQEFTVGEVASTLRISENTVKTRLKRGREKLGAILRKEDMQWDRI
ncbi:sigma-70 family RNA polymerase sigma factor [Bacillus infantis]|uniref:Sigma-70 family RNA polymerase sigma factor n=1 Tax=Bacillus infantis TaxID=324767 RepID=A0A5D4RAQ3_9BACI|nr:sigma-70 family RNA polymerase sigma factor [Bacillus infantis]